MEDGMVFTLIIVTVVGGLILSGVVILTVASVARKRAGEQTKRELFAYVAEGSITPEDAANLVRAMDDADLRKKLADDCFWGLGETGYKQSLDKILGIAIACGDGKAGKGQGEARTA